MSNQYIRWPSTSGGGFAPGGTTLQYVRGDASLATLNQAAIAGLMTSDSVTFAGVRATSTFNLPGSSLQYVNGAGTLVTLNQSVVAGLTTSDSPTFTGVTVSGGTVTGLPTPVNGSDAVNLSTLQSYTNNIIWKSICACATTANITLSGTQTIDGYAAQVGDRVLVKNQTTQSQNGIYIVAAGAWPRSADLTTSAEFNGASVMVDQGTVAAGKGYFQTTVSPTVGTSSIVWVQNFGTGTYTADGTTVTLSGNQFSVATGGVSNSQVSASAAIAYSKLALSGAILNTDLAGSIAYSKLVLSGAILNSDLAGSISTSKITAPGTSSKVMLGDFSTTSVLLPSQGGTGQNSTAAFPTSGTVATVPANGLVVASSSVLTNITSLAGSSYVKAPTTQKFLSGTGTYTTPTSPAPLYIRVRMVGGGGGGSGSSTSAAANGTSGGNGGNTTFGSSLLVANAGGLGSFGGSGGAGGTASLGTGPVGLALTGASGSGYLAFNAAGTVGGSVGGSSTLGGAGGGGAPNGTGFSAAANSGSGGGSAGLPASGEGGGSGGAGGFVDAIITSPLSTYSYAVGAGGTAGSAGTSGAGGGVGAAGMIIVDEFYQ